MAYVLKQVGDESPEVNIYAGTVKFGSNEKCDLVIDSENVLPVHGEVYHQIPEYRIVASHSALIEINDKEVLKWPAVLHDGDVITIGDTKFNFSILQPVIKRSKKSAFSAYLAAGLLGFLLIFEVLAITWLPAKLREDKAFLVYSARQQVIREMDDLRGGTRGLSSYGSDSIDKLKNILLDYEDKLAEYLRKYSDKISLEQALEVRKQQYFIKLTLQTWPSLAQSLKKSNSINPEIYLQNLSDLLMSKLKKEQESSN